MGKNITLREGDTSKQFTADKIKTNLVGGGTCDWVPEDEAIDYVDLEDHEFKQNGTYTPDQFNADAFRQVKVNVPTSVKEKTIKKNGTYKASDESVMGYSKVIVDVPGGGGGDTFAFARTTFLQGQSVVATDGVTTLNSDTSGYYVFAIPNAGLWTFTCQQDVVSYDFEMYGESSIVAISYLPNSDPTSIIVNGIVDNFDLQNEKWDTLDLHADVSGTIEIIETGGYNAIRFNKGWAVFSQSSQYNYFTAYAVVSSSKYTNATGEATNPFVMSFTKELNNSKSENFYKSSSGGVFCASTYGNDTNTSAYYLYDAVLTIALDRTTKVADFYCNGALVASKNFADMDDFVVSAGLADGSRWGFNDFRFVALVSKHETSEVIIANQQSLMQRFNIGLSNIQAGKLRYTKQSDVILSLEASDFSSGGSHWGDFDVYGSPEKTTDDDLRVIHFGQGQYATLDIPQTGFACTIYLLARAETPFDGYGRILSIPYANSANNEPCILRQGNSLYIDVYNHSITYSFGVEGYTLFVLQLQDGYFSTFNTLLNANFQSLQYSNHGDKIYLASSLNGTIKGNVYIAYIGITNGIATPDEVYRNARALQLYYNKQFNI